MSKLTQLQVQLIRGDIRQHGVELRDLEEDLLDHICTAIEEEESKLSFEKAYELVKQRVCPNGFREIQEETTFLIIQKYNNMKNLMNIFGIAGSLLFLIGSVLKFLRLAGGNEALLLGTVVLVVCYLPMMLSLAMKQTDTTLGKVRNYSGFLGASLLIVGMGLDIIHWQYGSSLLIIGLLVFLFLFIPLFFKSIGPDAFKKIQPATVAVLLLAGASALFAFNNKKPSHAYINSLLSINADIEQAYHDKFDRLKANQAISPEANKVLDYITELKSYLVQQVGGDAKLGESNMLKFDKVLDDVLVGEASGHPYSGKELHQLLKNYLKTTGSAGSTLLSKQYDNLSWEATHFKTKPLYSVYTTLSNFQLEIVSLELERN